jgi:hypothetical protein
MAETENTGPCRVFVLSAMHHPQIYDAQRHDRLTAHDLMRLVISDTDLGYGHGSEYCRSIFLDDPTGFLIK